MSYVFQLRFWGRNSINLNMTRNMFKQFILQSGLNFNLCAHQLFARNGS